MGSSDEAGLIGKMVGLPKGGDSLRLLAGLGLLPALPLQLLVERPVAVLQLLLEELVLAFTK